MGNSDFFKQATLSIFSSLDFSQALCNARRHISQTIPVDGLFFNIYEPEKMVMRTITCATESSGQHKDIITRLNHRAMEELNSILTDHKTEISYYQHPSQHYMAALEAPILGYEGRALMVMQLYIGEDLLGTLVASAMQDRQFTPEHLRQMESLREPFTIALHNIRTHEELGSLKDKLADDNRFLRQEISSLTESEIIGADGGLRDVKEQLMQVSSLMNTVIILGETGVGKEVIANAIHSHSPRRNGPFIKVNCGAIPESLIDSELFGHEKGAFSGAISQKRGRFERANGGTIFLDEIGELPPQAQVRLLRVLQNREIERVGGTSTIKINARIIAATHRNLEELVAKNQFREDLLYRLMIFPIVIPPLRQRKEDIPALARHFVQVKAREMGLRTPPQLDSNSLAHLSEYSWPGNVRELENAVERALIGCRGGNLRFKLDIPHYEPGVKIAEPQTVDEPNQLRCLDAVMKDYIVEAIKATRGKINGPGGAAEHLCIHPNTLRKRMKKLGIEHNRKMYR